MNKTYISWCVIIFLVCVIGVLLIREFQLPNTSSLVPNWNYSATMEPNMYQWLANSFVFVLKRPNNVTTWDYGEQEYALSVIERGTSEVVCPAFSGLAIEGSDVDLDPFIGKAVLITSFTRPDESAGSIYIERLELDPAVNERIDEYRLACPMPFSKMDQAMGITQ